MGYEDKCFAAGCSRDVIRIGAERLGRQLDELLSHTPDAMRVCEKTVDEEMAAQKPRKTIKKDRICGLFLWELRRAPPDTGQHLRP